MKKCTGFVLICSVFCFLKQDMALRALKQTGSRNIEAALEYISKMGYLDPHNEQIVRVIKQTSPGMCTLLKTYYYLCTWTTKPVIRV